MEQKAAYGIVHCHSENSVRDASQSVQALVDRAIEMGEPAVVLTDHGVLTGTYELKHAADAAKKRTGKEIKVVPGVEGYFKLEDEDFRRHIILIPKDGIGYKGIIRAVTESNKHLDRDFPIMDVALLKSLFGPGAPAHGHVIATSACAGGIIARTITQNEAIDTAISKIDKKMEREGQASESDEEFVKLLAEEQTAEARVSELEAKRADCEERKKKSRLTPLRKAVKAFAPDSEDYTDAVRKLEEAEADIVAATNRLENVKEGMKTAKKQLQTASKAVSVYRQKVEKWQQLLKNRADIEGLRASEDELFDKALKLAKAFQNLFGKENFFIELQYHGLDKEKAVMPQLVRIARAIEAPLSAANDAHYTRNTPEDMLSMRIARFLRFEKWRENPDDSEYYLKSAAEIINRLSEIIPREVAIEAMEGTEKICNSCGDIYAEIKGTHYPVFRSEGTETAKERLRRMAEEGIPDRYPGDAWTPEYEERMNYELETIDKMGFSDYLCIVQDYVHYGRELGVNNPEGVGLGIGSGRGSAVGSIVCYLSGITAVDPMKHNLLFERFLNPERVSMPDIDVDFRTDIRGDCINYVQDKYGVICGILTKNKNAAKNAIKNAARALGAQETGDTRTYLDLGQRISNATPADMDLRKEGDSLKEQFNRDTAAGKIIDYAKTIFEMTFAYGVHAAGVVISDCGDVGEYVPLMYNTKKEQWISQTTMEETEGDAGLLKMDFLGLRNLDIITDALRRIKRNTGKAIDIERVQEEPEVLKSIFASGNTDSIFQFESTGMKNVLTSFAPTSLEDLILLVAAYRPGPMEKIPQLIDVKFGKKSKDYIFPEMGEVLDTTYGYPIYQEQVQEIFHKFAGFSLGEADIVRRAMAKKHIEILTNPETNYKGRFIDGMLAHGAAPKRAEAFWEDILAFASYAFNKSHAAAYAYIAYYTGWLKYHYPLEYMTAVLNYTALGKLPKLVANCREMGLEVLPPDVNSSEHEFSDLATSNSIRVGFSAINGMGNRDSMIIEERQNGRFDGVQDFFARVPIGSLGKQLAYTGAFDAWITNRKALAERVDDLKVLAAKIKDKQEKLQEAKADIEAADEAARPKALQKYVARKNELSDLNIQFSACFSSDEYESKQEQLAYEKKELGFYVTGSPIDSYPSAKKVRTFPVSMAKKGRATLCGCIENVSVKRRKKDGVEFAFLELSDETGSIDAVCFAKEYANYRNRLTEGAVYAFTGVIREDESRRQYSGDDEGETRLVFQIQQMKEIACVHRTIMVMIPNLAVWVNEVAPVIKEKYLSMDGDELVVFDESSGKIRKNKDSVICVNRSLLDADIKGVTIKEMNIDAFR